MFSVFKWSSSSIPVCFSMNSLCVPFNAAAGEAQEHRQYGGAAAAVRGGRSGLWRPAGGFHTAIPVPAAALQRHEGTSNAVSATDQGNLQLLRFLVQVQTLRGSCPKDSESLSFVDSSLGTIKYSPTT